MLDYSKLGVKELLLEDARKYYTACSRVALLIAVYNGEKRGRLSENSYEAITGFHM